MSRSRRVLRFWLEREVDGCRVDASAVLIQDDLLRDDPGEPDFDPQATPPSQCSSASSPAIGRNRAGTGELRAVVDEFPDRVLAGEVQGELDCIGHFYDNDRPSFQLPLNFALLDTP
jgi:alpha-glucosidase